MERQESNIQLPSFKIDLKENDKCVVFFNELIETEIRQEEETERTIYVYSTYELKTNCRANLEAEITANYESWLNHVKTCDEITTAQEIRAKRNKLLTESDYTQVEDAVLSTEQKQAYQNYRQSLRDISSQAGFPYKVEWPKKPNT